VRSVITMPSILAIRPFLPLWPIIMPITLHPIHPIVACRMLSVGLSALPPMAFLPHPRFQVGQSLPHAAHPPECTTIKVARLQKRFATHIGTRGAGIPLWAAGAVRGSVRQ